MTKKKNGRTAPREWGEWEQAVLPPFEKTRSRLLAAGLPEDELNGLAEYRQHSTTFINNIYQVSCIPIEREEGVWVWLSIKRRDKKAVHDWRHLQRIKSELMGDEREAVEIYPPESDLVDEANQYHLWVLPEGLRNPVGFREGRRVGDPEKAALIGAKQRAFTV